MTPGAGRHGLPALFALVAMAVPAAAGPCRDIDALDNFAATGAAPPAATCAPYVDAESGPATACFWTFDYRAAAAADLARRLWRDLTSCRPGAEPGPQGAVNHPDSYSLRIWSTETATYSVSVKDKGALGQTLAILRRAPRPPAPDR